MEVGWDRCRNGDGQARRGSGFLALRLDACERRALNSMPLTAQATGLFRSDGTGAGTVELATKSNLTPLGVTMTPDGDFNGDGLSDILWQNANGQASIWELNGTNLIAGGSQLVGPNPGPSWTRIGTGDFNGDGHSDILWQNANGQAAIWEMNGTNQIAGGALVGPNPGPSWKAIGTGDFNGDGHSDILWQNTRRPGRDLGNERDQRDRRRQLVAPIRGRAWKASEPATSTATAIPTSCGRTPERPGPIWEMNGTNVIGGRRVGPNPGPSWKAVGTGDFNGDGHSDILWQNANGQASIWEMNGTNVIGGGTRWSQSWARVGKRSERATSTATAIPTSCGRTPTVRPRSGK